MINGLLGYKKSLNIFTSIGVVKCKKFISSGFIIIRSFNFLAPKKQHIGNKKYKKFGFVTSLIKSSRIMLSLKKLTMKLLEVLLLLSRQLPSLSIII